MKEDLVETFTKEHPVPKVIKATAAASDDPLTYLAKYAWTKEGKTPVEISLILEAVDKALESFTLKAHINKIALMQDQMKVCSFCESPEQLLMWSHYSDYHKGFCVEYNIARWLPTDIRRRILYPVIYQKELYDFTDHHIQSTTGNFNNLYPLISGSTKSTEWEYEKEWRFIFNIGDSFPVQNYPMNCQSAVYLGFRMGDQKKEEIKDIAKMNGIKVFQAKPSTSKYQRDFELVG